MVETILDVQAEKAREFFLRQNSFCNIGLPKYFDFTNLIETLQCYMKGKIFYESKYNHNTKQKEFYSDVFNSEDKHPKLQTEVNYLFFKNKDGRFDWRPMQIIDPVIYIFLVNWITDESNWNVIVERFSEFSKQTKQNVEDANIYCFSLPWVNAREKDDTADSILNWWSNIEQRTLEYAMEYNYLLTTDISDCYGSIYTHSITWAMCGKDVAKNIVQKKKTKITEKQHRQFDIGDKIDKYIEAMSNQQTNGIPQGSVLMDFIAELVLGYADLELSKELDRLQVKNEISDYKILRYRDDYRIFGKTQEDVIKIAKALSEILSELNFRLNTSKTAITQDVISGAIKPDKLYYICQDFKRLEDNDSGYTLQKQLLRIYKLSIEHPNSGMLQKAIEIFFKRLCENNNTDMFKESAAAQVLISIVTNIAYNNPRVYKIAVAIIGKILSYETDAEVVKETYERILKKFDSLPNVGYLEIWLQRLTIKHNRSKFYNESICQYAAGEKRLNPTIWNISWLKDDVQKIFIANPIVNEDEINNLSEVIEYKEIETFNKY